MANFCNNCGAALGQGAQFCSGCGTSVVAAAAPPPPVQPAAPQPAPAAVYAPQPMHHVAPPPAATGNSTGWIVAGIAVALLVIALAYFALNRTGDAATDVAPGTDAVAASGEAAPQGAADNGTVGPEVVKYVTSAANIRNVATARGPDSRVMGSLRRGTQVRGTMAVGLSGDTYWLKLSDGRGYVSAINLSDGPPAAQVANAAVRVAAAGADFCAVNTKSGNLRIRQSPGGRIVGGMPYGARFQVLSWGSASDEWIQVQPMETRYPIGWVSAQHIQC